MKTLVSLLAISSLGLGACIDSTDESIDTTEPGSSARIAMNSLQPGQLVVALSSGKLTSAGGQVQVSTQNGRASAGYIIGCALGSGQSYSVNVSGGSLYTFQGDVGLATNWLSGSISLAQAQAISACVLARLNQDGTPVSISMRSSALSSTSTELSNYYLDEGTFFGQIFPDQGTTVMYGCPGADKLATPTLEDLANRKCTVDTGSGTSGCNLVIPGHCSDICTWDATGKYRNCTAGGTTYTNAITTFVQ